MFSFLIKPIIELGTSLASDWSARKRVKVESQVKIAEKEVELKVAKIDAAIKREEVELERDNDYDMQVLRNRDKTMADEIIVFLWFSVFVSHFIPQTQPYMAEGWASMGYTDGPAWWFEFGMVGILVSTLGLMRLFKMFFGKFKGSGA